MPANWAPQNSGACQEPRGGPAEDCQGSASGLRHGTDRRSHTWASRTLPLPPAPGNPTLGHTVQDEASHPLTHRCWSVTLRNEVDIAPKRKPEGSFLIKPNPLTSTQVLHPPQLRVPLLERRGPVPSERCLPAALCLHRRERRLQIKVTLEVTEPTAEPTAKLPSWLDWDLQQKQRAEQLLGKAALHTGSCRVLSTNNCACFWKGVRCQGSDREYTSLSEKPRNKPAGRARPQSEDINFSVAAHSQTLISGMERSSASGWPSAS